LEPIPSSGGIAKESRAVLLDTVLAAVARKRSRSAPQRLFIEFRLLEAQPEPLA